VKSIKYTRSLVGWLEAVDRTEEGKRDG